MKTIAIIAECNPLHNGHAWIFREARRHSGADFLIVLLSGDYVQRGEPAVFDKYLRTAMALEAGADLVLELPVACATGSAQRFATGAVTLLDRLGVVDELWFGSETGRIAPFLEGAAMLTEESGSFRARLKAYLAEGLSMPAARDRALSEEEGVSEEVRALLRRPNDTLGLEYVLALHKRQSRILPQTLPRQGVSSAAPSSYAPSTDPRSFTLSDEGLSADGYASASALRSVLLQAPAPDMALRILAGQIPEAIRPIYKKALQTQPPLGMDDFSPRLSYALQQAFTDPHALPDYLDLPEELTNRIGHALPEFRSASQFAALLKTKERTLSQIRRALLHILLQLSSTSYADALQTPTVRMLGHRQPNALFSMIKKKGQLSLCAGGAALLESFYKNDLFASRLYEAVRSEKSGSAFCPEETRALLTRDPRV